MTEFSGHFWENYPFQFLKATVHQKNIFLHSRLLWVQPCSDAQQ